ncbi:MAG: lactate utilization protein [Mucilaginibacter sp.]|nr:lactate utilization protein [Mucilaginibacter sp.]
MNSREKILSAVIANQPELVPLPELSSFERNASGCSDKFVAMLKSVGGFFYYVSSYDEIINILLSVNGENKKIISTVTELTAYYSEEFLNNPQISNIHDIDVAVLKGRFGVAENGAIWLTDQEMRQRALPFICQHLAVILNADSIIPTMHEAYELISKVTYDFATFIAGPSKTADIEQSLVIGAHGPRSMTVFVMINDQ